MPIDAIRHAQQAEDWILAAELLAQHGFSISLDGTYATIRGLLEQFPRDSFANPELAAFVAADLGVRHATILTSSVEVFAYDRASITTAGRYLVTGSARTDAGEVRAFSFFVKVIHAYHRSPLRFAVPEQVP